VVVYAGLEPYSYALPCISLRCTNSVAERVVRTLRQEGGMNDAPMPPLHPLREIALHVWEDDKALF
jgi:hypothetical protein